MVVVRPLWAIFILLSDGTSVKWRKMGDGDDSLLGDLT